jgi:hypothetical protein
MLHRPFICAAAWILSAAHAQVALGQEASVRAPPRPAVAHGVRSAANAAGPANAVSDAIAATAKEVLAARDNGELPFAVVDKHGARIGVYHADGALAGVSAVLLGKDPGDDSIPGVGERAQAGRLRPGDRTTPAGRYVSQPGWNRGGEPVVWLDFEAALAIHRVRAHPEGQERARRLASGRAEDRRVSAGCVVVPVDFFRAVVQPLLGRGPAVVYVLSETKSRARASEH